jgi:hypothetical protein
MKEKVCKICGKSFKNLGVHVKNAHNMSMEEYAMVQTSGTFTSDIDEKDIGKVVIIDTSKEGEKNMNSDLSEILEKYNISRDELFTILDNFFKKRKIQVAGLPETIAKELSSQDKPSTQSLKVAEILINQYGFKVVGGGPTTKGGTIPKTWFLQK